MTIAKPAHRGLGVGHLIMVPAATMMLIADAIILAHSNGKRIRRHTALGLAPPCWRPSSLDHLGVLRRGRAR